MKRFSGTVGDGTYEVILIDSSIWVEYTESRGKWQGQKTEFHLSTPDFVSIERSLLDGDRSLLEAIHGVRPVVSCEVSWDFAGDLAVKLTNASTGHSVEWVFMDEDLCDSTFADPSQNVLASVTSILNPRGFTSLRP